MTDQHFTMKKKVEYILLQVSRLQICTTTKLLSQPLTSVVSLMMTERILEVHNTLLNTVQEISSKIQLT